MLIHVIQVGNKPTNMIDDNGIYSIVTYKINLAKKEIEFKSKVKIEDKNSKEDNQLSMFFDYHVRNLYQYKNSRNIILVDFGDSFRIINLTTGETYSSISVNTYYSSVIINIIEKKYNTKFKNFYYVGTSKINSEYVTLMPGVEPYGFEVWDLTDPKKPVKISISFKNSLKSFHHKFSISSFIELKNGNLCCFNNTFGFLIYKVIEDESNKSIILESISVCDHEDSIMYSGFDFDKYLVTNLHRRIILFKENNDKNSEDLYIHDYTFTLDKTTWWVTQSIHLQAQNLIASVSNSEKLYIIDYIQKKLLFKVNLMMGKMKQVIQINNNLLLTLSSNELHIEYSKVGGLITIFNVKELLKYSEEKKFDNFDFYYSKYRTLKDEEINKHLPFIEMKKKPDKENFFKACLLIKQDDPWSIKTHHIFSEEFQYFIKFILWLNNFQIRNNSDDKKNSFFQISKDVLLFELIPFFCEDDLIERNIFT